MPGTVRIKICGITTPEDAQLAAEAGADAIGLNFFPGSPRFVTPTQAAAIVRVLPPFTVPVGVFVGMPFRQVCAIAFQLGLRAVQTYDELPPGEDSFPFAHIPAFRVRDEAGLDRINHYVEVATQLGRRPRAILIDSHVDGSLGGTGRRAPWELLARFQPGPSVILAGGLTAENVAEAIAMVNPWGVDVASGVESITGKKDREKMLQFMNVARPTSNRPESR